jgi:hypothetical protein
VFTVDEEVAQRIRDIGLVAFTHTGMGLFKLWKNASKVYGDDTFGAMMWLKTFATYLVSAE